MRIRHRIIRTDLAYTKEYLKRLAPSVQKLSQEDEEKARLALEKLVTDGRIHPGRIEELIKKSRKELDAKMSLLVAAFKGARAVRSLSARGVDVEVELHHKGFADSIALVRTSVAPRSDGASRVPSKPSRGGGRTYALAGMNVRVVDRDGPLVSMSDVSLDKEGDEARSSAAATLLGDRSADHAFVESYTVELRRSEDAWQLSRLAIESGNLRALRNGDVEKRALATRLKDAFASLRGEPARSNESAEAPSPPEEAGEPDEPLEPVEPEPTGPRPSARLFARLAPDANVSVSGIQIESRTNDDDRVKRIRDFRVSVEGRGDSWYRVVVDGETSNKGTLSVDVSLNPIEARAEGSVHGD